MSSCDTMNEAIAATLSSSSLASSNNNNMQTGYCTCRPSRRADVTNNLIRMGGQDVWCSVQQQAEHDAAGQVLPTMLWSIKRLLLLLPPVLTVVITTTPTTTTTPAAIRAVEINSSTSHLNRMKRHPRSPLQRRTDGRQAAHALLFLFYGQIFDIRRIRASKCAASRRIRVYCDLSAGCV